MKTRLALILLFLSSLVYSQPALAPVPKQQFFSTNGTPLAGGYLYTYIAGTSTPQTTYTSNAGGANTNPIVLDSAGRANIWLGAGLSYKFVLTDSVGNTIWTVDNITAGPLDMMTTDTVQMVTANKTFGGTQTFNNLVVTGTCAGCGGGGGGSTAFGSITSGTNTVANMVVGSGAKLGLSGTGAVDFSIGGATTPAHVGLTASLPMSCAQGQIYFATDASAGQNLYYCTAANTWTQQLNGGGGSAFGSISSGTNTTATMQCGAGCLIKPVPGSTGNIEATELRDRTYDFSVIQAGGFNSAVDYILAQNGATGTPGSVALSAQGSDSNISFAVTGKGTGVVYLGGSGLTYVDNSTGNLTVPSCTGCGGGGGSSPPFSDASALVKNNSDATKLLRFDLSGLTTATTRIATVPNSNFTIAGTNITQTFSGTNTFSALQTFNNQITVSGSAPAITSNNGLTVSGTTNLTALTASANSNFTANLGVSGSLTVSGGGTWGGSSVTLNPTNLILSTLTTAGVNSTNGFAMGSGCSSGSCGTTGWTFGYQQAVLEQSANPSLSMGNGAFKVTAPTTSTPYGEIIMNGGCLLELKGVHTIDLDCNAGTISLDGVPYTNP